MLFLLLTKGGGGKGVTSVSGGKGEECMHYLQIQHEPVVESLDISIPLTLGEGEEGVVVCV